MKNKKNFIKMLNLALSNPDEFDIKFFRKETTCNTTYCFAGRLPQIDSKNWRWEIRNDCIEYVCDPDKNVKSALQDYFGLTFAQINDIFFEFDDEPTHISSFVKRALEIAKLHDYILEENKLKLK